MVLPRLGSIKRRAWAKMRIGSLSLHPSPCGHVHTSIFTSPPPHNDLPHPLCSADRGESLRWGEIEYLKKHILDWLQVSDGGSTLSGKERRGDVPCQHIDRVERPEGTWYDTPAAPDRGFSGVLGFCATLLSASDLPGTWAALDPFRREQSIPLQSPSPCCYHYSDRLRLSRCYWNATGEHPASLTHEKKNLENDRKVEI